MLQLITPGKPPNPRDKHVATPAREKSQVESSAKVETCDRERPVIFGSYISFGVVGLIAICSGWQPYCLVPA